MFFLCMYDKIKEYYRGRLCKMRKKKICSILLAAVLSTSIAVLPVSAAGWQKDTVGWWYQENNGSYPRNQWKLVNGQWYWFNGNGYMVTGWNWIGGSCYYMYESGAMASNTWIGDYYVNASGAWVQGKTKEQAKWIKSGDRWWYRHADGNYTRNGWELIGDNWYLFDSAGWMLTGWQKLRNDWYYMESSGAMLGKGWHWIGGSCYYMYESGAMASDTWIGDDYVNPSGAWVPNYEHKHEFTEKVDHKNATCQTEGYDIYKCSKCDETKKVTIAKIDHDYKLTKKVDATCTADGYKEYTCSMCGNIKKEIKTKKLGHDFSIKKEHKDATCQTAGYDLYKCSRCNETKKVDIAKVDHNYQLTKTVKATCQNDGYKEYTCTMCGDSYQEKLAKVHHDYKLTKNAAATCTADGYKEYTCSMCGNVKKEVTAKKLGHDFSVKKDHKDANCQAAGYDLYKCNRCNETKKVDIAKVDHDYKLTKKADVTCTTDGYKEYTCNMCKDSYRTTIAKLGHDFSVLVEHKDSTCVEQGYDIYKCSRCEETQKTMYDLIPHDYDMNTEVERVDSTCTTKGHINYACKVCGNIKTVELPLNPDNHTYEETGRDLEYIYYKCKECGATKKEFNDQTYTIDLGNGKTTTVVGHFDLEMRQEILDLVNKRREIFESKPLSLPSIDSSLQNAANIRAYEITYSYSHTRPNGERGITSFHVDGENLAEGFTSASDVCQAWFASLTHDLNITNNSYNTIGIGVFCAKTDYGYENYFSQMFSCDKLE